MIRPLAPSLAALAFALALASPSLAQEPPAASPATPPAAATAPAPVAAAPPAAPPSAPAAQPGQPAQPAADGPSAVVSAAPREAAPSASARKPLGLFAGFGGRYQWMSSRGYDPYSSNDFMAGFDLFAGGVVLTRGKLSLAVAGGWAVGEQSAKARGQASSLTLHRLWLGPEGRFALLPWLRLVGRVAPHAYHARASVSDAGSPGPLSSRTWGWGVDAAAGVAADVFDTGPDEGPYARFWAGLEAGYTFAGTTEVVARPRLGDDPRDYGGVRLPDLQPSGPLMRFSVGVSF